MESGQSLADAGLFLYFPPGLAAKRTSSQSCESRLDDILMFQIAIICRGAEVTSLVFQVARIRRDAEQDMQIMEDVVSLVPSESTHCDSCFCWS